MIQKNLEKIHAAEEAAAQRVKNAEAKRTELLNSLETAIKKLEDTRIVEIDKKIAEEHAKLLQQLSEEFQTIKEQERELITRMKIDLDHKKEEAHNRLLHHFYSFFSDQKESSSKK